jgi:hypothetical protein
MYWPLVALNGWLMPLQQQCVPVLVRYLRQ